MTHRDHWSLETACPCKNCGAGKGAQCLVHPRGWDKSDPNRPGPKVRDGPHVVRIRHAREQGHEPEGSEKFVRQILSTRKPDL